MAIEASSLSKLINRGSTKSSCDATNPGPEQTVDAGANCEPEEAGLPVPESELEGTEVPITEFEPELIATIAVLATWTYRKTIVMFKINITKERRSLLK